MYNNDHQRQLWRIGQSRWRGADGPVGMGIRLLIVPIPSGRGNWGPLVRILVLIKRVKRDPLTQLLPYGKNLVNP